MNKIVFNLLATILFISFSHLQAQNQTITFENAFKTDDLNKVEINVESSDWRDSLNSNYVFIKANLSINDELKVQVRLARKGNSSKNNTLDRDKIPFKIDGPGSFNFKLNNSYRDYTLGAREYIGYRLHQEYTGIGSKTAPVEVYVNGEFYGLYLAVEDLNRRFYDRNVGGISHRVKASPTTRQVFDRRPYSNLFWLGENPQHYEGRYEVKKGSLGELINLIDVINNFPDEAYKVIDIEQVCKFLAVENYLMNVDGIIGEVYSHNYELVKRIQDDKWQLVP